MVHHQTVKIYQMGFHVNDPNPRVDSALNKFVCV